MWLYNRNIANNSTRFCAVTHTLLFSPYKVRTAVEDIDGLDDVENSILYYNQAIIHYHLRQYSEAIVIGEKLYQFLEPFGMFRKHIKLNANAWLLLIEDILG